MQVYQLEKIFTCTGCGTRRDEWKKDLNGKEVFHQAYVAEAYICEGCRATEDRHNAEVKNAGKDGNVHGLKVRLVPTDLNQHLQAERRRRKGM